MTDDQKLVVERVIDQPAGVLFEILSNPERHKELDETGTVVSDHKSDRIQEVGQVFTMNMHADAMGGDYQTDNHVTGYEENKRLAWQTVPAGTEPAGWQWMWELEPQGSDSTLVRLTYDWSKVTDKKVLERVKFPLFPESMLEQSLSRLATAAGS
ncbi:SRPBCC family protein [Blastococcus sp. Marseille-P5729]|uniref:SRPBCC family protein n=1 Tax=Blastococcus sp. Marseille-P5729 TaxID=2086582 RepID=UPI000D0E6094|nr:SRPBCC family protein [Blastococcus sp. Marseille-P5729]